MPKSVTPHIQTAEPIQAVVLRADGDRIHVRDLARDDKMIFRPGYDYDSPLPGETLTIEPKKEWVFGSTRYLSGKVERREFVVETLALKPLKLRLEGEHDWASLLEDGDEDLLDPIYLKILEAGSRVCFEMEQRIPGTSKKDPMKDPIIDAMEIGHLYYAREALCKLLVREPRCLDAYAHIGHLHFNFKSSFRDDHMVEAAFRAYDAGLKVAELSFDADFEGALPWFMIHNRPYLRCLQGYMITLWRMERFEDALQCAERLLWLNPDDNQGVRMLLDELRSRTPWTSDESRARRHK